MVKRSPVKTLMVAVVVLSRFGLAGVCSAGQLEISGLKASYLPDTAIEFMLTKKSSDLVSFFCAAEILLDGKFTECRSDIFKNGLKPRRIPFDMTRQVTKLRWDTPKLMRAIRPRPGSVYRLRFDVITPKPEQIFSEPFSITQPSNQTMKRTGPRSGATRGITCRG
jgi:hypothetical protein